MQSQALKNYKLPDNPGVYKFIKGKELLYIGKATSLKDRVKSYFSGDILETRGPKIDLMLKEANKLEWQETGSVLEALLLEAALIKKHQPPYNTREKDDKSYWYVVITKEDFPIVKLIRGRSLVTGNKLQVSGNKSGSKFTNYQLPATSYQFGPFPHATEIKEALKIIRRIFTYRDERCKPKP